MQKASCFLSTRLVKNPFFILAGTHFYYEKSAKVLHYFGLDCALLDFYSRAVLQRTIVDSYACLEPG